MITGKCGLITIVHDCNSSSLIINKWTKSASAFLINKIKDWLKWNVYYSILFVISGVWMKEKVCINCVSEQKQLLKRTQLHGSKHLIWFILHINYRVNTFILTGLVYLFNLVIKYHNWSTVCSVSPSFIDDSPNFYENIPSSKQRSTKEVIIALNQPVRLKLNF